MYKNIAARIYIPFIAVMITFSSKAQVKLPALFADGVILQRNMPIPVWGWASPGEKITVSFLKKQYSSVADNRGKWTLKMDPVKEGGPYSLQVKGSNTILLNDVLVGDVYICSGQSNMDFRMYQAKDKYAAEIAASANTSIRQLLVNKKYNFVQPSEDITTNGWKAASPENTLQFTAVGYFFAKSLFDKYHIPIGLIHTSWGGTPAESWVSEEAIQAFPNYYEELQRLKDSDQLKKTILRESSAKNEWYQFLINHDAGISTSDKPWFSPDYIPSDWKPFRVPGFWEEQQVGDIDGVVWFKKEIELPVSVVGKKGVLNVGFIADEDTTYVNGIKIGWVGSKYNPRKYEIPAGVLKAGKNSIVVRVLNKWGKGGFISDKEYSLQIDQVVTNLKGGDWLYKTAAVAPGPLPGGTNFHYKPVGLYNAMIAPLLPYAITGVIWYQGEANTAKAKEYQTLFPTLIKDWRKHWGQGDFPFLYVQLANYFAAKKEPGQSDWAELREAQLMTLQLPNTGMAVISDIGEWNDVHPLNKLDVGKRLALAAEKTVYHEKNLVYSGPLYAGIAIKGGKAFISFTHTGSGLVAKGDGVLHHFAIAGADHKFVWAKAEIKGNKVEVWSDAVPSPVAVRYAWADNPEGANLYNKEGLPASLFRTDAP